ncbi:hypothetical protein [Methanobrevibacter sp.]|uniref:hypothetical protein n=1 Tax=Methanobrevibacter sp. TaxID=66852 RepID=UPI00388F4219
MNNKEFDQLEKVLSDILTELQIQNKLRSLQLVQKIAVDNGPLLTLRKDKYDLILKDLERTLNGNGLKKMRDEYEEND